MSVELICVAPDRVHEFWPHVSDLIHRAIRRTNLSHSQDIDFDVLNGDGLLWIAWNGSAVEAAATTSLIETDAEKVCVLTACGGAKMRRWLGLLGQIEDYAKAEGCSRVRIFGRKGWVRVLERYRIRNVILEKEL
ncbi:hypothetical protein V1291_005289 [Nitrobacteraceae bacterium AZCC 1564]